jgi:hypothetical protein
MSLVSRRQLLLAGAGAALVAACGGDDHTGSGATTTTAAAGATAGGLILFNAFQPAQPVGQALRLPLGVADREGSFDVDLPRSINVQLRKPDGTMTAPVAVALHEQDLPRGYFPLRTTFDVPGRWGIVADIGDTRVESTVDARPAGQVPAIPGPGDPLPNIPTPTGADAQGVRPICTRDPICPFHTTSLDQAIGGGQPIALLVSTPAFCSVAICGPVLDLLVTRQERLAAEGITTIHAEVYVDEQARQTTATVNALGLDYEPALFLAAPDGTVTERFDYIYDGAELDEALAHLVP